MHTDESSDEIDGLIIHSHSTPERLLTACREGQMADVTAILRTWGCGFAGGRSLPAEALLEAIAWARVEVVRLLLDHGASVNAHGSVSTPGGSGVVDSETQHVSAMELCRMMVSAGLRPRRALTIARLVEANQRSEATTRSTDEPSSDNHVGRRMPKRPLRFEAGPSRRARFERLPDALVMGEGDDDAPMLISRDHSARTCTAASVLTALPSSPRDIPSPAATMVEVEQCDPTEVDEMVEGRGGVTGLAAISAAVTLNASCAAAAAVATGIAGTDAIGRGRDGGNIEDTGAGTGIDLGRYSPSRDEEICRLQANVRELRQMLGEQGKILQEQNALLSLLYRAGTAAADTLASAVPLRNLAGGVFMTAGPDLSAA